MAPARRAKGNTMHKISIAVLLLGLAACKPQAGAGTGASPSTDEQKTFYALGMTIGRNLGVFNMTKDELAFVHAGMAAQVLGDKPAVELQQFGPRISQLARSRSEGVAAKEKEKSKSFLETAAKEEGAQKSESGLVYKALKEGTGAAPAATDLVKVHYRGTLTDGKEFDSSYSRNEPAQFPLNGVIRCWTEGVQKMKVGGKAKLVCPSEIAYGDQGSPPNIPGGATLVFEVELLEVAKAAPGNSPGAAPAAAPQKTAPKASK